MVYQTKQIVRIKTDGIIRVAFVLTADNFLNLVSCIPSRHEAQARRVACYCSNILDGLNIMHQVLLQVISSGEKSEEGRAIRKFPFSNVTAWDYFVNASKEQCTQEQPSSYCSCSAGVSLEASEGLSIINFYDSSIQTKEHLVPFRSILGHIFLKA